MQNKNVLQLFQIIFLIGLLVLVRAYENDLFYDPFLSFFKTENSIIYPEIDFFKLFFNLFFRYFLNTIISLAMLYVFFKDINILKFSSILYFFFFIILVFFFFIVLFCFDENQKTILFYIRRFLIQPLFLLLFLPGFYFQELVHKK